MLLEKDIQSSKNFIGKPYYLDEKITVLENNTSVEVDKLNFRRENSFKVILDDGEIAILEFAAERAPLDISHVQKSDFVYITPRNLLKEICDGINNHDKDEYYAYLDYVRPFKVCGDVLRKNDMFPNTGQTTAKAGNILLFYNEVTFSNRGTLFQYINYDLWTRFSITNNDVTFHIPNVMYSHKDLKMQVYINEVSHGETEALSKKDIFSMEIPEGVTHVTFKDPGHPVSISNMTIILNKYKDLVVSSEVNDMIIPKLPALAVSIEGKFSSPDKYGLFANDLVILYREGSQMYLDDVIVCEGLKICILPNVKKKSKLTIKKDDGTIEYDVFPLNERLFERFERYYEIRDENLSRILLHRQFYLSGAKEIKYFKKYEIVENIIEINGLFFGQNTIEVSLVSRVPLLIRRSLFWTVDFNVEIEWKIRELLEDKGNTTSLYQVESKCENYSKELFATWHLKTFNPLIEEITLGESNVCGSVPFNFTIKSDQLEHRNEIYFTAGDFISSYYLIGGAGIKQNLGEIPKIEHDLKMDDEETEKPVKYFDLCKREVSESEDETERDEDIVEKKLPMKARQDANIYKPKLDGELVQGANITTMILITIPTILILFALIITYRDEKRIKSFLKFLKR
ncbi:hypothetical protein O9G_004243 [Rozella allomycis CSF55]|uniref:Uncharacterized protein n=1 Tax=Rozella allomycis (strain CSF55) TaxID=988480 RepID=A0A075ATI3_ROZAC|nr:hypothetical protein O9G_004243 [Rozella allomycis CSF55]|eukprot:EPZ31852.1 hypothetical protein O9G_004243 [Rozella allomycis CSF55]